MELGHFTHLYMEDAGMRQKFISNEFATKEEEKVQVLLHRTCQK
jgi:hypothetical protein